MEWSGDFSGPGPHEYANVMALNSAFLDAATTLKSPQKGRLVEVPFLLFSLRETDVDWWCDALQSPPQNDFVDAMQCTSPQLRALQSASLGFLWQLARQNPYATRVISGASSKWCELIADQALIRLLDRVVTRSDMLVSRLDEQSNAQLSLVADGASSSRRIRRSAHLVALQQLLTVHSNSRSQLMPAAACSIKVPTVQRSGRSVNRVSAKKV